MSETWKRVPRSGLSDQHVSRVAQVEWDEDLAPGEGPRWDELTPEQQEGFAEDMQYWASFLVPPGYDIVKRGHWIAVTPDASEAYSYPQPKATP